MPGFWFSTRTTSPQGWARRICRTIGSQVSGCARITSAEAILAARVRTVLRAAFSFAAERLPGAAPVAIYPTMFVVTEADATAIRSIYEQEGELSAAIEVRRRFPGIVDNEKARQCARTIAGWTPRPISRRPR
jgi:hypothetical protein